MLEGKVHIENADKQRLSLRVDVIYFVPTIVIMACGASRAVNYRLSPTSVIQNAEK